MKNLKRASFIILALTLMLCLSVPALADYEPSPIHVPEPEPQSTSISIPEPGSQPEPIPEPEPEPDNDVDVTLNFTYDPSPAYTVTIPAELDLEVGDNELTITLSDAKLSSDRVLVIRVVGTQAEDNAFVLENNTAADGKKTLPYDIYDYEGGGPIAIWGRVVTFLENGSESIIIHIGEQALANIEPLKPYSGTLTFGIELMYNDQKPKED